ncbi:hypothetical protein BC833DRAFT_604235 [Globomyces pollinis-pini]|nr:hypothetical protein BC833DRAFT_604235 [Globomyces pollinis-pini]
MSSRFLSVLSMAITFSRAVSCMEIVYNVDKFQKNCDADDIYRFPEWHYNQDTAVNVIQDGRLWPIIWSVYS